MTEATCRRFSLRISPGRSSKEPTSLRFAQDPIFPVDNRISTDSCESIAPAIEDCPQLLLKYVLHPGSIRCGFCRAEGCTGRGNLSAVETFRRPSIRC